MEKIIYNNKLKKTLISILVIMMLMTYVRPYVALASDLEGYEVKTYTEWVDYTEDEELVNYETRLFFESLDEFINAYNDEQRSKKINEILSEPDKLKLDAKYTKPSIINWTADFDISGYGIIDEEGEAKQQYKMKYQELLEWSGRTSEQIDPMIIQAIQDDYYAGVENLVEGTPEQVSPEQVSAEIFELNKDIIILTVYGTKDEFEIRDFEIPGKSESDAEIEAGDSLGVVTGDDVEVIDPMAAMILNPLVALATFLSDTLMSILSTFMTQSEFEFVMVDNVEDIADLGEPGTTYTITNMNPYKNAFQILSIDFPNFKYSPEEIFEGNIDLLNVNFIEKSNDDTNWNKIRNAISSWYKVIRMVAIIGLLSALIYTGIKIIISSNSKDKAKYKEFILNWFIGVILVFTMHYIMAFILNIVEEVMQLLKGLTGIIEVNMADGTIFETNLMGLARFQLQQRKPSVKIGYLVIYIALITYTFKFTFIYLKRVLKMAFLTVLSPIVALTYPIDKANDGKAQGFEMWLKEFMYNALLQPLHYILYYVLVTTSLSLAVNNLIYAIAALMFISQAEKLLKRIFRLGKSGGGKDGSIAGAFATGAVTGIVNNMARDPMHPLHALIGGGKGSSSSGGSQSQQGNERDDSEYELSGVRDDTGFENYLGTNMRLDYATQNYGAQNGGPLLDGEDIEVPGGGAQFGGTPYGAAMYGAAENAGDDSDRVTDYSTSGYNGFGAASSMPLVDDFINKYRQDIPDESLEMLSFNDGLGSMKTLIRRIGECEEKLSDPNLSDADRQKWQQRLFRYKAALQKRLTDNEAIFNNLGVPLQYADGDRRTNNELIEEMMRLRKLASNPQLSQKERDRYGAEYDKLFERLKRRMQENQYIQNQGGLRAIMGEERYRKLTETNTQQYRENKVGEDKGQRRVNEVSDERQIKDEHQSKEGQMPKEEEKDSASPASSQVKSTTNLDNNSQNRRETAQTNSNIARRAAERKAAIERFQNARVTKGLANVGKTIIKPAWDVEKSASYNTTRLVGNLAKALAGATVGITAAAVQAGISITDGTYKPLEGVATFGAGFVGASRIAGRVEGLVDVYREAAYSEEDRQSLEKYGEQWFNRDDIISNYNREFPGQGKLMRQRAVNNYVSRGITKFEEQKQALKFAEQLKKERGMSEEEADWIAIGTLRYRQNLIDNDNYEILFDEKSRKNYLDAQANTSDNRASRDDIRRKHEEFLQNIMDFDRANR